LRNEGFVVVVAQFAQAVGGRRGSVDERNLVVVALLPQPLGVAYVQFFEYGVVKLGSVGAGPDVKDELYVFVIGVEPPHELPAVHEFADLLALQVAVFLLVRKVVNGDNRVKIVGVEAADQATSDETSSSRNYDHNKTA
jgi:hypothetical protein